MKSSNTVLRTSKIIFFVIFCLSRLLYSIKSFCNISARCWYDFIWGQLTLKLTSCHRICVFYLLFPLGALHLVEWVSSRVFSFLQKKLFLIRPDMYPFSKILLIHCMFKLRVCLYVIDHQNLRVSDFFLLWILLYFPSSGSLCMSG